MPDASAHCKRLAIALKRGRCRRAPLPPQAPLKNSLLAKARAAPSTPGHGARTNSRRPNRWRQTAFEQAMYEINAVPRRRRAPSRYAKRRVRWLAFQDTRFARWRGKPTVLRTRKRALQFERKARTG